MCISRSTSGRGVPDPRTSCGDPAGRSNVPGQESAAHPAPIMVVDRPITNEALSVDDRLELVALGIEVTGARIQDLPRSLKL